MLLASYYLARAQSPLAAYNALQVSLMLRFIGRGGTAADWVTHYAEPFRRRFGWMLTAGAGG
jgi:hypothetical protein